MPKLTIDNISVEVPAGTTVLEAAQKAGVQIPTLCYMKDVQAIGACRGCTVEVEGVNFLVETFLRGRWVAVYYDPHNLADVLLRGADLAVKPEQVIEAIKLLDRAAAFDPGPPRG